MTEQLTHFKKLQNPDYLGSYELPNGEDMILTIKSVAKEMITGTGGKKEEKMVIHFLESVKPMICNRTNAKLIAKILKTPYIEKWAGKQIQLYSSRITAFGEEVDALRVRDFLPQAKQIDTTQAIAKLKLCKSLNELKTVYSRLTKPEQGHPDVIAVKDEMKGGLTA